MKKIKYILLILLLLLSCAIIYLFMPLNLEGRYNFEDEIPNKIIVIKVGVDSDGRPLSDSIQIENKETIMNIYDSLKDIKLSKSTRSSKHTNQYIVKIINYADTKNPIKVLALADDLVNVKGLDYRIVNSQKTMEKIIDILEKEFNT